MENSKEAGRNRRKQIMDFIISYLEEHGYAPTYREIGEAVGLKSTSSVDSHITKLMLSGELETDAAGFGSPRALRVPGYKFVKEESHVRKNGAV